LCQCRIKAIKSIPAPNAQHYAASSRAISASNSLHSHAASWGESQFWSSAERSVGRDRHHRNSTGRSRRPAPRRAGRRKIGHQRLQGRAELILGRAGGSKVGELLLGGFAESGNRGGESGPGANVSSVKIEAHCFRIARTLKPINSFRQLSGERPLPALPKIIPLSIIRQRGSWHAPRQAIRRGPPPAPP
jgi:hypothetical protein